MPAKHHLDFKLNKDQQAFAAEHVRLAYSEAHRFARRTGIPYEDLVGAAHIGLSKGAYKFDPSMGYKPSTYLVSLIRGELLHHCRDKTYLLRISHRMRELWMKGRKFIPYGHSDGFIAKELEIEVSEWLECRHVCSGPPLQLNDTIHEVTCSGDHGKTRLVEDDRTQTYVDCVKSAWESNPSTASSLFWGQKGVGTPSMRLSSLESIINAACEVLDGGSLAPVDPRQLKAASYGGEEEEMALTFEEEDLGNGRIQRGLF